MRENTQISRQTLSATDPKKPKPIGLVPLQMAPIPQTTAERVASLKPTPPTSSSSSPSGPSRASTTMAATRATSQTISSMQKQSDLSLRSQRNQLPTIAGSPSVGGHVSASQGQIRDMKDYSLTSSFSGALSSLPKETPTRIPRIASRSSGVSPPLKISSSLLSSRRASLNVGALSVPSDLSLASREDYMDEFGVLENGEEMSSRSHVSSSAYRQSLRSSPSSASRASRQGAGPSSSASTIGISNRKVISDSVSLKGLRKASTGSVSSMASAAVDATHRISALSPSKGLSKLLSPKISLPATRLSSSSTSPNAHLSSGSPSPQRQSLSTPSPAPSSVDEDEIMGDEEMLQYIKRQQARKLANGAKKEDLEEMLRFPEPLPPGRPTSPSSEHLSSEERVLMRAHPSIPDLLQSDRSQDLSDYERKEIVDYPSVYCIGNKSEKKMANRDVPASNFGYDDERGDYLVVNRDHLAYRYEIIDTLGKGSFGQVLHCRDHCTGESVAIKIIRNKKRFHHQALVEIKILEI